MRMSKDVGENQTLKVLSKKRIFRKEVDILGITAYEKLSFHKHIKNICRLPKAK